MMRTQEGKPLNEFLSGRFSQYQQKVPLVIFGAEETRCGVTGVSWRALKKREAEGRLSAITIDEYLTSQICSVCGHRTLKDVLCETCNKIWQRDDNAARNMLAVATSI
ncbi:hypothetical protein MFLAVUS_010532 [Mucor flavus]|uniref:Cas12f1-like TNB domain-containing protein n=1 Tax=Mucor flavus TaxID=439312 RepID=A0ABP9ZD06_9FUNG